MMFRASCLNASAAGPPGLQVSRWDFCSADFISSVLCGTGAAAPKEYQRLDLMRLLMQRSRVSSEAAGVSVRLRELAHITEVAYWREEATFKKGCFEKLFQSSAALLMSRQAEGTECSKESKEIWEMD